ncbi:MAG: D-alanyl-D-alanine carboxypeptidase/D-alanyl-D-alanine-endopeptidase [Rhodospirillaceae bacterium]|nr:D-alanyl-D-alanine carboxypeptidase/D-alanyl-D-alanine-endopeptidase [Rhodospirillaceae bacterium]
MFQALRSSVLCFGRARSGGPPGLALLVLLAFVVLVPAHAYAQANRPPQTDPNNPAFDIARAIAAYGFAPEQVGYHVIDTATGAILASRNPDSAMIPASVAKVPTTIAALDILGGDYRFRTDVLAGGPLVGGVVQGDLYLRAGGDPFLTTDDLAELAERLHAAGVLGATGRFVYDATLYPAVSEIDPHQPETAAYNTGVSAFALNFNVVNVHWSRAGGTLAAAATTNTDTRRVAASTIRFGPVPAGLPWSQFFTAADDAAGEAWQLAPALPPEGEDWLPVRQPAPLAAAVFASLAREAGIALAAPESGMAPAGAVVLASHQSRPLSEIVRGVLRFSNNLSAEMVGLAAMRALAGQPLEIAQSGRLMGFWLSERFPGIDWQGFLLDNHSGLSTASRVTSRQLVDLLVSIDGQRFGDGEYVDLLRMVPWVGELNEERRTAGLPPVSIRAKSGTMNYAVGLAGLLEPGDGRRLAFAIFVNDQGARAALDAAADDAAREVNGQTRAWLNQARLLERDLLTHWALAL